MQAIFLGKCTANEISGMLNLEKKRKYFCTVVLNFCQFINSRRKKALFAIYAFLQEFFLLRTLAEYFSFFKTCV